MNNSETTPSRRRVGRNHLVTSKAISFDEISKPFKSLKQQCVELYETGSIEDALVQAMFQISITVEQDMMDSEIRHILHNLNCLYKFFKNKDIKQVFELC